MYRTIHWYDTIHTIHTYVSDDSWVLTIHPYDTKLFVHDTMYRAIRIVYCTILTTMPPSQWVPQVSPIVSLCEEEECVTGGGIGKVHRWWVSFLVRCGGSVFLSSSLSHLTLSILGLNLKRIWSWSWVCSICFGFLTNLKNSFAVCVEKG